MMEHSPAVVYQMNTGHVDVVNDAVGSCQEGIRQEGEVCAYDEQPSGPPPQQPLQTEALREERVKEMDENDVDRILARPPALRRKLLLDEAPEFVQRLGAYKEIKAGETLSFSGTYRAFPTPTIKWYKDEEELQDSERFETSVDQAGAVCLTIYRAEVKDEGVYKCKVENHEGVASTTGYLCVIPDPAANKTKSNSKGSLSTKRATERATTPTRNLHPIVEQSSMEAKEEEVCRHLGPSPLRDFIDVVGRRKRFSRQAPGPIVFFHDPSRDRSEEAGIDADVDNVFDADSDSPSSPSDQLTPRLLEPTSHTSFPCMTSSVITMEPPVEHFRNPCVNDDSDYDSDTTPRALILEPSNLISMSLDPEPTLWEDFLAGGTGSQQCLSHDSAELTTKHNANESLHSEKTSDMTANTKDMKGVSMKPFMHETFVNSLERCVNNAEKGYTKNIVDLALGKSKSNGPHEDFQGNTKVSEIENKEKEKSNIITNNDVITISNIVTENDVTAQCNFSTENHVISLSAINTSGSNEGVGINFASDPSQFNVASTKSCKVAAIDDSFIHNISAESIPHTEKSLLLRESDDSCDPIVKLSVQNQSSGAFDIFNKNNTATSTPLQPTKFTIASSNWNKFHEKNLHNPSDGSASIGSPNDYENAKEESSQSMIAELDNIDPLKSTNNTPAAVKSYVADTTVCSNINKTFTIDDTSVMAAVTLSPITPRDSNMLIHDELSTNKRTIFQDASNASALIQSIHSTDTSIDDAMCNTIHNISSNEQENRILMAQGIFETNKALEECRVINESYMNCKFASGTLTIEEKQSDEIFDSKYISGEQNRDDIHCSSLIASHNLCSNKQEIDWQSEFEHQVLSREVKLCSNTNYTNKGSSDDNSIMGWLCDVLDVTTLQFYLLFVTISTAIAALSDVPCPGYLVAATAFVVLLIETCRTIVAE